MAKGPTLTRAELIGVVKTPLGFFVLIVLFVEAALGGLSLATSQENRHTIILGIFLVLFALIGTVAALAIWRPEALQGRRAFRYVTVNEAMLRSERFSKLLGAYILVHTLTLARRGYNESPYGYEAVMSDIRKKMYGSEEILGDVKLERTDLTLMYLVGRALKTMTFHRQLGAWTEAALATNLGERILEKPSPDAISKQTLPADMQMSMPTEKLDISFTKLAQAEIALASSGVDRLRDEIVRIIWRNCERALVNPDVILAEPSVAPIGPKPAS